MENKEPESFKYTYSAKQQEEIKQIRSKYIKAEESKLDQIKRLDKNVTKKATILAISVGIIGVLILGFGMSLAMSELAQAIGINNNLGMILGVVLGIVGLFIASCAYPIFNFSLKKERQKISQEIIKLTDEIIKP